MIVTPDDIKVDILFIVDNAPEPVIEPRHSLLTKDKDGGYSCMNCGATVSNEQLNWSWEEWSSHPLCVVRIKND